MKLYTENRKQIEIEDNALGSGGQGSIHKIISGVLSPSVVKIFNDASKAEAKIRYMCSHNPLQNSQQMVQESFTWPINPIFDFNNKFVGYSMLLVEKSKDCFSLTNSKGFSTQTPEWMKFNINLPNSYNVRLKLIYNLLQALVALDEYGQYCIIDLKPENLMLKSDGHITIIDVDNFQIVTGSSVIYSGFDTKEYAPPEGQSIIPNQTKIDSSWDYFSFAVIAYQILFCIHPFLASHPKYTTLTELIENGYFVHGKNKNQLQLPPPHNNFNTILSKSLQDLFIQCFDAGHLDSKKRPNYIQWREAFLKEIHRVSNSGITAGANQPLPNVHVNNTSNNIRRIARKQILSITHNYGQHRFPIIYSPTPFATSLIPSIVSITPYITSSPSVIALPTPFVTIQSPIIATHSYSVFSPIPIINTPIPIIKKTVNKFSGPLLLISRLPLFIKKIQNQLLSKSQKILKV